jgi:hypothetical protein
VLFFIYLRNKTKNKKLKIKKFSINQKWKKGEKGKKRRVWIFFVFLKIIVDRMFLCW